MGRVFIGGVNMLDNIITELYDTVYEVEAIKEDDSNIIRWDTWVADSLDDAKEFAKKLLLKGDVYNKALITLREKDISDNGSMSLTLAKLSKEN